MSSDSDSDIFDPPLTAAQEKEQLEAFLKHREDRRNDSRYSWEYESRWNRIARPHGKLVDIALEKKQHQQPLDVKRLLPGTYAVQWHGDIGREPTSWVFVNRLDYYNEPEEASRIMKLYILPAHDSDRGLRGIFKFGLVEGLMLMASSREDVDLFREEQPKRPEYDSYDELSWSDDDSDREEEEEQDGRRRRVIIRDASPCANRTPGNLKRKHQQVDAGDHVQAEYDQEETTPLKRQQFTTPVSNDKDKSEEPTHPNRIYFQMASLPHFDGTSLADQDNTHIGHFDFDPEKGFTAAKGEYNVPWLFDGYAQSVSIYKIADPKPDQKYDPYEEDDDNDDDDIDTYNIRNMNMPWYMLDGEGDDLEESGSAEGEDSEESEVCEY